MPEPRLANEPAYKCPHAEARAQQIADMFEQELRDILSNQSEQDDEDSDTEFDPLANQTDDDFDFSQLSPLSDDGGDHD